MTGRAWAMRIGSLLVVLGLAWALLAGCGAGGVVPRTPTLPPTSPPEPTPTATPAPTSTPTPKPPATPTPTPEATPTPDTQALIASIQEKLSQPHEGEVEVYFRGGGSMGGSIYALGKYLEFLFEFTGTLEEFTQLAEREGLVVYIRGYNWERTVSRYKTDFYNPEMCLRIAGRHPAGRGFLFDRKNPAFPLNKVAELFVDASAARRAGYTDGISSIQLLGWKGLFGYVEQHKEANVAVYTNNGKLVAAFHMTSDTISVDPSGDEKPKYLIKIELLPDTPDDSKINQCFLQEK